MPKPTLPKADRAIVAQHEAGMHDKRPKPETCRNCAQDAIESAVPPAPIQRLVPEPVKALPVKRLVVEPEVKEVLTPPLRHLKPEKRREVLIPGPGSTVEYIGPALTTREAWLLAAVDAMRPDFVAVGREVPEVRISIGWPGGRSARLDPLGQCWHPSAVGDGITAIFITPSQDDPVQVLATTRHEMVHAAGEMNHKAGFRKLAAQVGFDPQPGKDGASSTYRTPELQTRLEDLFKVLGPFPHSPVNKGTTAARETQGTRMLKVECGECECIIRMTAKWIETSGVPTCGCGGEMALEVK